MINPFISLNRNFNLQSIFFRRAARTALAIFISVVIYRHFSLTQGFWVSLTVVIVMQATTAATLRKGFQRLLGTLTGILLGSLLVLYVNNPFWRDFLLILFLFIAYYLKAFNLINYGIFVVPLTMMVVFLVSALVPQESSTLILARLYDTGLGAIIAVIATLLILPNSLTQAVEKNFQKILLVQHEYFTSIIDSLLFGKFDAHLIANKRQAFEKCLSTNRLFFADWRYELFFQFNSSPTLQRNKSIYQHKLFLQKTEKIGQFLLSLHQLAISYSKLILTEEEKKLTEKIIQSYLVHIDQISEEINLTPISPTVHLSKQLQESNLTNITTQQLFNALLTDLDGYFQSLKELQTFKQKYRGSLY